MNAITVKGALFVAHAPVFVCWAIANNAGPWLAFALGAAAAAYAILGIRMIATGIES